MRSNLLKVFKILCIAICIILILPCILPLPPEYSISDTYSFMIHHPISWAKQTSLPFIFFIGILGVGVGVLWGADKYIKKLLESTNADKDNNDFKKIFELLCGVCAILLFTLVIYTVCVIIDAESVEDLFILFFAGLFFCFTLWTLYSMLRCQNAIQLVRAYFICMIVYVVDILLNPINMSATIKRLLDGDLEIVIDLLIFIAILTTFIRGLIISYKNNFVIAFPKNKDISNIQIFIICVLFFCLEGLRHVDF